MASPPDYEVDERSGQTSSERPIVVADRLLFALDHFAGGAK